ncbi:MAG TPA: DNA primase [Stellaceae bacterium]|jgi:DNA primase|nr:DNA primase [Stellaceae bacterium]
MAFPPGFLDELRSRLSLADLVGRRVRLTRKGREYGGLCPFHNEKTPSFYVVEDKGFFHCFGCGAHGDAIGFAMRADNLDFIEAVERLAGEAGLAVPQQTPQERERAQRQKTLIEALAAAADFFEAQLWSPAGARARDYLAVRGLDEETIRRFRLGWAPDDRQALRRSLGGEYPEALLHEAGLLRLPEGGGTPYDYFRGRVIFPIGDRAGRVIAFGGRTLGDDQPKYLNSPDTPVFEKGRVLYAWAAARAYAGRTAEEAAAIIVVEGYMDVIALHCAGFGGAVAPLGTALTETQMQELWRLAPEPLLCFDGDAAGQRAALRALHRALPILQPGRSLRFATLPPGEDPDSLIRSGGSVAVGDILAAAQPLCDVLWQEELTARAIDTPERRADLECRLMAQADTIADRNVQNEYRRFLRERLFALGRPTRVSARPGLYAGRRRGSGNGRGREVDAAHDGVPPPPPRSPGRVNREVFLGIFVHHPALIDEWVEDIVAVDLPEPELDRLRQAILEIADSNQGLDASALRQHLAVCGHADIVDTLAITIARHAGFAARGGDDPEVIRLGLAETLQLLHMRNSDDRAAATRALAADVSDENWRRLQALKEREEQDGPVGGFDS